MRRTRRTSTHALIARFKLSALLAHLTTKTLPTLIVVGLEVPVLAPAERPLPFATSLRSIVCFSRIARGTHHHRAVFFSLAQWSVLIPVSLIIRSMNLRRLPWRFPN